MTRPDATGADAPPSGAGKDAPSTGGAPDAGRIHRMRQDVRAGLGGEPRTLPPKYFYDAHGSALFEEITTLPEYYLTEAERTLLERAVAPWLRRVGARTLVELGAGSAAKTRILLDAMHPQQGVVYTPLDVSAEFLANTARAVDAQYDDMVVRPIVADLAGDFELPADLPRPMVVAFLGSTIGNFEHDAAIALMRHVRTTLQQGDRLLLGADLKKERGRLEAAYNDLAGVTARFNLNVLRVLNRELGADFDLDAFAHRAYYDEELGRVEMHLVSVVPQRVEVPGVGTFDFDVGQSIRTEISRKHDRAELEEMLARAGLSLEEWFSDGDYVVLAAAPA